MAEKEENELSLWVSGETELPATAEHLPGQGNIVDKYISIMLVLGHLHCSTKFIP